MSNFLVVGAVETGDALTSLKPIIETMAGDVKALALYGIPLGFGIYMLFWGAKFLKRQITKNARG